MVVAQPEGSWGKSEWTDMSVVFIVYCYIKYYCKLRDVKLSVSMGQDFS